MLRLLTTNKINSSIIFNVLEENDTEYLVSIPYLKGTCSEFRWWVKKTTCLPAYRAGQRWQYIPGCIVELTIDSISNVKVVQIFPKREISWKENEIILNPSIESMPDLWVYLRGQDKP
jgi:hypothetical protein